MVAAVRYRTAPTAEWRYVRYSVMNMAYVVNAGYEYGIEGRDYFRAPTHWGVS